VLRRGGVHNRRIIINFAADRVLRSGSADRGVHAGARQGTWFIPLRLSLLSLVGRLLCSDVMFQICVCGIMRYFTVFIVCCF